MSKLTVSAMVSLDGVMQAPGAPKEDTTGGFKYGGWTSPYANDEGSQERRRMVLPSGRLSAGPQNLPDLRQLLAQGNGSQQPYCRPPQQSAQVRRLQNPEKS